MTFSLLLAALFLVGVPFALLPLLRTLNKNKNAELAFVSRFYEIAGALVAHDELPNDLIPAIEMFSRGIGDANFTKAILRAWIHGEIGPHHRDQKQIEYENQVKALPKEVRDRYQELMAVGLIAVTYAATVEGALLRWLLFRPAGIPEQTEGAPLFAYELVSDC